MNPPTTVPRWHPGDPVHIVAPINHGAAAVTAAQASTDYTSLIIGMLAVGLVLGLFALWAAQRSQRVA